MEHLLTALPGIPLAADEKQNWSACALKGPLVVNSSALGVRHAANDPCPLIAVGDIKSSKEVNRVSSSNRPEIPQAS